MDLKLAFKKFAIKFNSFCDSIGEKYENYEKKELENQLKDIDKEKRRKEFLKQRLETTRLKNQIIKEKSKFQDDWGFGNLGKVQTEEFTLPVLNDDRKNERGFF